MKLKDYLGQFINSKTLTIVGPMSPPPSEILEPIVYVDGGTQHQNSELGYSVGDGDSSKTPLDETLNQEKDFSDLSYVLNQIPHHFPEIHLYGFLGGRRDHELFNLGEIHHFLDRQTEPTHALLDNDWKVFSRGNWETELNGRFSLVCFANTTVELDGEVKYKIPPGTKIPTITSFGLSNWANGEVILACDGPVFLYTNKS